jgi:hypothetical protein
MSWTGIFWINQPSASQILADDAFISCFVADVMEPVGEYVLEPKDVSHDCSLDCAKLLPLNNVNRY